MYLHQISALGPIEIKCGPVPPRVTTTSTTSTTLSIADATPTTNTATKNTTKKDNEKKSKTTVDKVVLEKPTDSPMKTNDNLEGYYDTIEAGAGT